MPVVMSDWFASCEGHKVKVRIAADLVCMYKSSLHILFEIVVLQGSMRRHWLLKTLKRRGLAAWQAWRSKAIVLPGPCLAAGHRAWCARERRKHSRQSFAVPRKLYLPSQRSLRCCLRPYSLPGFTPGKIRHALLQSSAVLSPDNVVAIAGGYPPQFGPQSCLQSMRTLISVPALQSRSQKEYRTRYGAAP